MVDSCARCGLSPALDAPTDHILRDRVQLRHRLAQLNNLLETLSAEREQLQAASDSIIYPVLSLPPEITSLIFIHCVPFPEASFPRPSPLDAPLLLAQICRQWRDIAINTQELWQSVAFVDTRSLELIKIWLSRSGNHPLNFSLNCVDPIHAAALIDVCKPHAGRWQNVELALPVGVLSRLANSLPMPLLRKIMLWMRGPLPRPPVAGIPEDPIQILNVPLLREAIVTTYPELKFNFPWPQLTTLTLARLEPLDCSAILKSCEHLVTLDISTTGPAFIDAEAPLTLPSLESFTFPSDFCFSAAYLRLPRLTHIFVRETVMVDAAHAGALSALITQSSAPIQRLSLLLKYPASETLERCLDAVSASVGALALHCGNAMRVAHLITVLRRPALLPALKSLSIDGGRIFGDDYETIPAMLQARRADASGPLETFTLLVQTYGQTEAARDLPRIRALPRFRALAAEGLKIRIAVAGEFHVGTQVLMDTLTAS